MKRRSAERKKTEWQPTNEKLQLALDQTTDTSHDEQAVREFRPRRCEMQKPQLPLGIVPNRYRRAATMHVLAQTQTGKPLAATLTRLEVTHRIIHGVITILRTHQPLLRHTAHVLMVVDITQITPRGHGEINNGIRDRTPQMIDITIVTATVEQKLEAPTFLKKAWTPPQIGAAT